MRPLPHFPLLARLVVLACLAALSACSPRTWHFAVGPAPCFDGDDAIAGAPIATEHLRFARRERWRAEAGSIATRALRIQQLAQSLPGTLDRYREPSCRLELATELAARLEGRPLLYSRLTAAYVRALGAMRFADGLDEVQSPALYGVARLPDGAIEDYERLPGERAAPRDRLRALAASALDGLPRVPPSPGRRSAPPPDASSWPEQETLALVPEDERRQRLDELFAELDAAQGMTLGCQVASLIARWVRGDAGAVRDRLLRGAVAGNQVTLGGVNFCRMRQALALDLADQAGAHALARWLITIAPARLRDSKSVHRERLGEYGIIPFFLPPALEQRDHLIASAIAAHPAALGRHGDLDRWARARVDDPPAVAPLGLSEPDFARRVLGWHARAGDSAHRAWAAGVLRRYLARLPDRPHFGRAGEHLSDIAALAPCLGMAEEARATLAAARHRASATRDDAAFWSAVETVENELAAGPSCL